MSDTTPAGTTTTTTPAGTEGGAGAPPAGGGGSANASSWDSGFAPDLKGYVELKGFKDPATVVDAYRNLEKLHGVPAERILKLPEKADDPAWDGIYNRLGRPEKADGYKIDVPEGFDDSFAGWAREMFHGLKLTKAQGDQLAAKWNERVVDTMKKQTEGFENAVTQQQQKLKDEWGAAFDQNNKTVEALIKETGLSEDQVAKLDQALGVDGTSKFLLSLVTKYGLKPGDGDPAFRGGEGGGKVTILSPDAAREKIKQLSQDQEWTRRYLNNGAEETAEMARLQRWALGMA